MEYEKLTGKTKYLIITALLVLSLLAFLLTFGIGSIGEKPDKQVDDENTSVSDSVNISTELGEFKSSNFAMSDEEIIWDGVHTGWRPNKTIEYGGTIIGENSTTDIEPWNYSANNYGLRGENIWEKDSEVRVLVLGSSLTMGHGVSYNDTYTKRLEDSLNREYKESFDIINAGIDYAGMIDHYIFLASLSDDIEPDVVVVSDLNTGSVISRAERKKIGQNIYKKIKKTGEKRDKESEYRLTETLLDKIADEYIRRTVDDYYYSEAVEYLRKSNYLMEKEGVEMKVFCLEGCMNWLENAAKEEGMQVIEGPEKLDRLEPEKYSYKDGHLKPRGHELVAKKLYDAVEWSRYS